jgi:tetratricopeptide (TPR) repeat protein
MMGFPTSSDKPVSTESADNVWSISLDIGTLWRSALLFLATLFSHWQAIGGGFIWDDDAHVTREWLRSLQGLWSIWFKLGATQQYYPLVHSAFWFEHAIWGDTAWCYHLTNIFLHTIGCFILVAVLRKLEIPGAWVAGFIFALHPVHVESVAWITEQKNTISAIFYLLAAYNYVQFDKERVWRKYGFATLFFFLALLSKTVTASLPAALLVIFWWKRGKLSLKDDVIPLLPWFVMGAAGGMFTAWVERVFIGAQGSDYLSAVTLTSFTRFLLAGHVIWFYLGKLLWPANLIFIYEHWNISASNPWDYTYSIGIFILLAVLLKHALKPWKGIPSGTLSRAPLAGFLFFSGTLFPVLGFANVYPFMFSYVADHFQYLASLGIIVPVAAGLTIWVDKLSGEHKGMGSAIGGVMLALLGFLSWNQCSIYSDAQTLYQATITKNPSCWMAHNNLGAILLGQGKVQEASDQFQEALKIRPAYPDAQSNMCSVLIRTGRYQEAISHGLEAIRLRPTSAENENNLAIALADIGRTSEAVSHYQAALKLRPNYVEVLNNLGNAYMTLGLKQDALNAYQTAIKYSPNFADAYNNLGLLLAGAGHLPEAIAQYEQAIKLQPNSAAFHGNLGLAYGNVGRTADSIAQLQVSLQLNPNASDVWFYLANALAGIGKFTEAEVPYLNTLKLNPNNLGAENNLAAVYYKLGRIPEAITHYQTAIRINPDYAEAHSNLGVALAAEKLISEAILEYQKAIKLNPKYSDAYNNLGLALTSAGNYKEAVTIYEKAIGMNDKNPDYHENLAKTLRALGKTAEAVKEEAIGARLRAPLPSAAPAEPVKPAAVKR